MTLAQKIGQMTQPEIKTITPDQVREYYIGSVLNGGGSWPERTSTPAWPTGSRWPIAYYDASMSTDMPGRCRSSGAPTPCTATATCTAPRSSRTTSDWARRATRRWSREIGAATARAVRATGIDWVFAPTVPVVPERPLGQDLRELLGRQRAGAHVRQGAHARSAGATPR